VLPLILRIIIHLALAIHRQRQPRAHHGHARLVRRHVVVLFVRKRRRVEVFDEYGEFFALLVARNRVGVELALFD
jgi:hypothetical protein